MIRRKGLQAVYRTVKINVRHFKAVAGRSRSYRSTKLEEGLMLLMPILLPIGLLVVMLIVAGAMSLVFE